MTTELSPPENDLSYIVRGSTECTVFGRTQHSNFSDLSVVRTESGTIRLRGFEGIPQLSDAEFEVLARTKVPAQWWFEGEEEKPF